MDARTEKRIDRLFFWGDILWFPLLLLVVYLVWGGDEAYRYFCDRLIFLSIAVAGSGLYLFSRNLRFHKRRPAGAVLRRVSLFLASFGLSGLILSRFVNAPALWALNGAIGTGVTVAVLLWESRSSGVSKERVQGPKLEDWF